MKKLYAILSIAAIALSLTATPAFAKGHDDNGSHGRGFFGFGWFKQETRFSVTGTVQSIGTGTIVLTSANASNIPNVSNGTVTIKTDANTKVHGSSDKETPLTLASIVVGQKISATGNLSGTDPLAKQIKIINSGVVVGKVTAKTATSVTITNGVTNESKTINTDADTKVVINGESKTVADVAVGDSGWVKFKTVSANLVAKFIGLFR